MKIAHIFAHSLPNAGDVFVREAVQWAFKNKFSDATFVDVNITPFTTEHIDILNSCDLVVIGGGGLFFPIKNDTSGWYWNCSIELMEMIKVPIVVYAVGYDRFRRQDEFDLDLFNSHVQALLEKSVFFSMRNTGSRVAMERHLPEILWPRLKVDYCPAVSMAYTLGQEQEKRTTGKIGILLAGDFPINRHTDIDNYTANVKSLINSISDAADVCIIGHDAVDVWISNIVGLDTSIEFIDLTGKLATDVIEAYSQMDTVIGDRGHSLMIPFALGCKIISIVSHDKLLWFLEDIGMSERGIEEDDPDIVKKVLSLLNSDCQDYQENSRLAMKSILELHESNLECIESVIFGDKELLQ